MGKNTPISWADDTWNPWIGCIKVSPGCKNCYMYRDQKRYGNDPADVHRTKPATFNAPLKWPPGRRVFTCSYSDFFIEEADEWRDDAWDIIYHTPETTYIILTKRPENILDRLPADWGDGYKNVWLVVSAENQEMADKRIPILLNIPAAIRGVSYEPALGPINFEPYLRMRRKPGNTDPANGLETHIPALDWIVTGGESGHGARSAEKDWFIETAYQCYHRKVAFFHKQNGGASIDGVAGGFDLDGIVIQQHPDKPLDYSMIPERWG